MQIYSDENDQVITFLATAYPQRSLRPILCLALSVFLPLILFIAAGCDSPPVSGLNGETKMSYLTVAGYRIPKLSSPEEQLAYARSSFDDQKEQDAALQAVNMIYPDDRLQNGLAALERAYLQLGQDYRLAERRQYTLALQEYNSIREQYADLAEIAAKAVWYMGWVSCDLLQDCQQGISYYQDIIDRYPTQQLDSIPFTPWLSIYLDDGDTGLQYMYAKSGLTWAIIAHLEIIRYSTDPDLAWNHYLAVRQDNPAGLLSGKALELLVSRHGLDPRSEKLIDQYLLDEDADEVLKKDLLLQLSAYRRQQEPKK